MSLLTIIQDAANYAGVAAPSSVVGNTNMTVQQLQSYCQMEGDSLSRKHNWRQLLIRGQILGTGTDQLFTLPDDFSRFVAGTPLWREDEPARPITGPIPDDEWSAYQAGLVAFTHNIWRLNSADIEIYPILTSGEEIRTEYFSTHWIVSEDGNTRKLRWTADSDYPLIPDRVLALGTAWVFKRFKGMDDAELYRRYEDECMREMGFNRGPGRMFIGEGRVNPRKAWKNNVRVI